MDGDAHIGFFFAAIGGLIGCVGVPLFFGVLFFKLRSADQQITQTAAAVQSGAVAGLLPWNPASLSDLTCQWVGSSMYTAGVFGRRDRASGQVPSGRSPTGWLLAFTMTAHNDGADGQVLATTSAQRLELRIVRGVCQAALNGAPLGSLRLGEPGLYAFDGTPVGSYRRQPPGAQLTLRGRDVARLDTRTDSDTSRAAAPTLLVTHLLAERTAEDEAWALVTAVLELAWFGPRRTHVGMQGQLRR